MLLTVYIGIMSDEELIKAALSSRSIGNPTFIIRAPGRANIIGNQKKNTLKPQIINR